MPSAKPISVLLAVLAALSVTACGAGEEGEIPRGEAAELLAELEAIESEVNDGDCDSAERSFESLRAEVAALEGVPENIQRGIDDLTARLGELLDQCEPADEEDTTAESEEVPVPETSAPAPEAPEEPEPEEESGDSDDGDDSPDGSGGSGSGGTGAGEGDSGTGGSGTGGGTDTGGSGSGSGGGSSSGGGVAPSAGGVAP